MVKKKASPPEIQPPTILPEAGIKLIETQIEKANKLLASRPLTSDDYSSWELLTRNYLEKVFGVNSPNVSSVMSVGKYGSFPMRAGDQWWENHRVNSLQSQINKLGGLIELLKTEIQLGYGGV